MLKIGKIMIFILILLFSTYKIIDNKNLNLKDNVYIVSESEINNEELIEDKIDETDNEKEEVNKNINMDEANNTITVFVSGEVNNPGVVTIESEKRLSDVVDMLGGTTENADLNKVNLAMKLEDESHYIIPKIGESVDVYSDYTSINNNESIQDEKSDLININKATIQELDALPGIGEATANKIINYREENGEFKSVDEIKNVNGIGDKKYEELKSLISIE
ncbi:helix-hairpin-helix domain-containing protein [Romboutsia sp. 13368]|uniref:helix-hairpin-helix domain-containing protein n=1 Tax=Romboutsia sp. 13368 TaxID=2708053 RepID=UPI0025D6F77A|nr:helix-hairpin-helix domain-containing protein [Romboutsia sp. 13368]